MTIPAESVVVPDRVRELSRGADLVCVWRNDDGGPVVYVLRVVAYGLIVIGILDKNRPRRP